MILAIESSCDESAVALFDPASGIAGEWVHSQMALHSEHGGVVPDIATREHLRNLGPLIGAARLNAAWPRVSRVAVTRGPGLAACLAMGCAAANAVGRSLRVPIVGVNHLRAHAWSPFMGVHAEAPGSFPSALESLTPHLGLIVSGGNTLLFTLDAAGRISELAATRDDAAGEALDKGAKLLGIGYPGGPVVERLAREGNPRAYDFPRGIGRKGDMSFSFSGLKTSLRYRLERMSEESIRTGMADLCASYQAAVVDALARKTGEALLRGGFRSVGLSGGVANNLPLREAIGGAARAAGARFLAAEPRHTGDNAAMIGFAAWADARDCDLHGGASLRVDPAAYL